MKRAWWAVALLLIGCGKDEEAARCTQTLCPGPDGVVECVSVESDRDHCGACGQSCDGGQLCVDGQCLVACGFGETNCDGTCAELGSSSSHCGTCGNECRRNQSCVDGECTKTNACEGDGCSGDGDCDGDDCSGAGGCSGKDCSQVPTCEGDECDCVDGRTLCGKSCVNLDRNESHCGECGRPCDSDQECIDGVCGCPRGTDACWFECLETVDDPANCGECGQLCANGTACNGSSCECPSGQTICDGTCVDLESSRSHCGDCGRECSGAQSCVQGECLEHADTCVDPAQDVDISRVALYQGVELDLFSGAETVPAQSRPVDIVRGRDALVRVFVQPQDGFTPRPLSARVTITDGGSSVFVGRADVSAASEQESLSSTLNVYVPGAALTADATYTIELLQCSAAPSGTVGVQRVPTAGSQPFEARGSRQIGVTFVPIRHDGVLPDTSPEILEAFAREVERQYPTTDVVVTLADEIESDETGIVPDLGIILDQITDKKEADGGPLEQYYYGIVDPAASLAEYCDGGCTTGLAWWLESTGLWALRHRAGVGVGFGTYGANTFAHELGHNMGRDHAPCGTKGDDNYPYNRGRIGTWGYDPLGGVLKDPADLRDIMGYCEPNWVSDYTYQAIFERLATTTLTRQAGPERTWASLLVTSTSARWGKPRRGAGAPAKEAQVGVVYDALGQPLLEVEVYQLKIADGGGYKLFVPPPERGWFAVGLKGQQAVPY